MGGQNQEEEAAGSDVAEGPTVEYREEEREVWSRLDQELQESTVGDQEEERGGEVDQEIFLHSSLQTLMVDLLSVRLRDARGGADVARLDGVGEVVAQGDKQ